MISESPACLNCPNGVRGSFAGPLVKSTYVNLTYNAQTGQVEFRPKPLLRLGDNPSRWISNRSPTGRTERPYSSNWTLRAQPSGGVPDGQIRLAVIGACKRRAMASFSYKACPFPTRLKPASTRIMQSWTGRSSEFDSPFTSPISRTDRNQGKKIHESST